MAKLSSTNIYGDLMVDGIITENGQLLSSKYAAASHGTHLTLGTGSGNAYRGDYGNTAYTHSQAAHAPSNAQKNSDITKAEIEAKLTGNITSHTHSAYAAASHGTHVRSSSITTGYDTTFRTKTKGDANSGSYFSTVRTDTASVNYAPQYGAGIAWGQGDTHGYLNVSYSSAIAYLGGGSGDKLNWVKQIAFSDHNHDSKYAAASHGTHLTLGTGSGNAYYGDKGNTAYTHSQAAHAPSNAQKNSDITKAEIEAKLTGAITSHTHNYAAASHGNHVPTTQTANNAVFLRNDNTWQTVTPANIGAAAASHGTHLTIGTGASNAAAGNHTHSGYAASSHSHSSLNIKGDNTITSTANDTTANWGAHGNSVHFYTTTGQLIDQPSQWGYILNIGKTNEVHQIWMTQASGDLYHRGGNANGWSGTWRKILDSSNYGSHTHSYLPLSGGTLTGPVTVSGESRFHSGTYSDPWSGTGCAIKATGNIGLTGAIRANGGVATLAATNGVATSDGATYVANLRYANSRGYCDLGSNTVPGRLYIRSGQGTAGSGVCVECAVTNGKAYVQYLSPEAGTIALTNHLSDRTKKENIVYVGSKDSEFTNKDFYNFIRDDLGLATYNYNEEYVTTDTHTKLNFIAQDILYDIENNCENKVGNLIVQTENAMRTQGNLRYDPESYTSVIAGALKESINKIEELEDKNKKLEERLAMLEEKFSALENK